MLTDLGSGTAQKKSLDCRSTFSGKDDGGKLVTLAGVQDVLGSVHGLQHALSLEA